MSIRFLNQGIEIAMGSGGVLEGDVIGMVEGKWELGYCFGV